VEIFVQLLIDGQTVQLNNGQTILEAAKGAGIEIPTLCHDPRVVPQGNCGLCIVEVEGEAKPRRACATQALPGMIITTNSPKIINARKTILALLLSDHTGDCRPPCMLACPAQTDCQGYVSLIANGLYNEAAALIREKIPLPSSIGRICPHPCETECRRKLVEEPINIAALKSFAGDFDILNVAPHLTPEIEADTGHSVGIIGGGPGGLTAAYFLRQKGHSVTIYDAMPKMGGMLRYGIPEYRLPKKVLDAELRLFQQMNITFQNNICIGKDILFSELQKQHDAIIVAIGAWKSMPIGCPGEEDFAAVWGGVEFLRDIALGDSEYTSRKERIQGKRVAVIGGGFTAMDVARTAIRLEAESVSMVYRRTQAEMPAEAEYEDAHEEGVQFRFLESPLNIIGENEKVTGLHLQKMELGEPDASGRRSPMVVEGAEEILPVDIVIKAIGQTLSLDGLEELPVTKRGALEADKESFHTPIPGVFAIGDAVNKGSIAIEAIGHAKKAAYVVHSFLEGNKINDMENSINSIKNTRKEILVKDTKTEADFSNRPKISRENITMLAPSIRVQSFEEVGKGLTKEQAKQEAKRCLSCGCSDFFECKLINYANQYQADAVYQDKKINKYTPDVSNTTFYRNPNKCILCGLCARVCDEVIGKSVLSVTHRGLSARVNTAHNIPIAETECVGCGQCVFLCPTGALGEILPIEHPLTVQENKAHTTCSFCSVGCKMIQTSKGDLLLRSLPDTKENPNAMLCTKGRFGFGEWQKNTVRLTSPLLKGAKTTAETACKHICEEFKSISEQWGAEALGIAISDHYTNEDMATIKEWVNNNWPEAQLFSLNEVKGGSSTRRFEDIQKVDMIVWSGFGMMTTHTMAGAQVLKAAKNGTKLLTIGNDFNFSMLAEAKNPLIIFDSNLLSEPEIKKIIETATDYGAGIIQLKPNCNSQGLSDLGIGEAKTPEKIRGLLIFGEIGEFDILPNITFLVVVASSITNAVREADVALPGVSFAEITGTYTNTFGEKQAVNAAISLFDNTAKEIKSPSEWLKELSFSQE